MLSESQIERFSRHILLREVGGTGQERLLAAVVRLSDLGEGGRACALWLARAGIGTLSLPVAEGAAPAQDASGLLLAEDVGQPLVQAVSERLLLHNPDVGFTDPLTPADVVVPRLRTAEEGTSEALRIVRRLIAPPERSA